MDAQGGATVSAEDGSHNYSGNMSRRGGGRDAGRQRNSGSNQRWIPSESRSSSSAARLSKVQNVSTKPGAADESSISTLNNGELSVVDTGAKNGSNNFRASGEVHSVDRQPNDYQDRTAKDSTSRSSYVSTIHSRGERGGKVDAAEAASSFVPYLPQDDAVVAGLGEQEGGINASETQEVIDLLNEQLSALLCLPPRQFWKRVATDESLGVFLDTYLHFRRRWFDNPLGRPNVSVVAGDGDLSRRAFMVLFRMSSNHDPGSRASESLSAKEHAAVLLERRLLDIPKLMDISAIYGHDNPDLTKRLVSNVFKVHPGYTGELAAYIPLLMERIHTMHQRCYKAVESLTSSNEKGTKSVGFSGLQRDFLEVVDFLNDVMITLKAFVKAYPPAAKVFVSSGNPTSVQGLFLPALATVHDTLLPIFEKGFVAIHRSVEGQQPGSIESSGTQDGADVAAQDRLRKLSARLVELVWTLLEIHYLEVTTAEDSTTTSMSGKAYEDAVWKGDSLVQAIMSLGPSDNEVDSLGGERSFGAARLVCTGALLQSVERFHGLSFHIVQARQRGTVVLDEGQQDHLSALLADAKASKEEQESALTMSAETFPLLLTLPGKELDEDFVIQQSKISQIKDLFPEYGDGFIAACLEVYDSDPEKVIERILDGTLHSDLLTLDTSLMTKPDKEAQPVKDKGKGKVTEQMTSSKGKSIWEDKSAVSEPTISSKGKGVWEEKSSVSEQTTSSKGKGVWEDETSVSEQSTSSKGKTVWDENSATKGFGSSSSLRGSAVASSGYSESSVPQGQAVNSGSNLGRYVRRQKDEGNFSDLLDSRTENENRDVRSALRAAAAEDLEYEDEYDDSFDELGGYVADAGGNEETETLADQIAWRGRAPDESAGTRNNSGRPVVLAPWGSSPAKGRGGPLGSQRASSQAQRSAPVVPEFEGQLQHTLAKGKGIAGGSQRSGSEFLKSAAVVPVVDGQLHHTGAKGRRNFGSTQRASSEPQKSAAVVPVIDEGQDQDPAMTTAAGQGRGGRGGRGRKKWKEQGPKPEFYLKDGKLYSYKVAGAVGVASVEEAEAMKQEELDTIHGLGAGGNVPLPLPQQDSSSSGRKTDDAEGTSKSWKSGEYGRQNSGEGGRGRGAGGRGRGRRDDNHHRKDQATKKHFGGLGGF